MRQYTVVTDKRDWENKVVYAIMFYWENGERKFEQKEIPYFKNTIALTEGNYQELSEDEVYQGICQEELKFLIMLKTGEIDSTSIIS